MDYNEILNDWLMKRCKELELRYQDVIFQQSVIMGELVASVNLWKLAKLNGMTAQEFGERLLDV